MIQSIHASRVKTSDSRHFDNFSFDQFNPVIFIQNAGFRHLMVLARRKCSPPRFSRHDVAPFQKGSNFYQPLRIKFPRIYLAPKICATANFAKSRNGWG